MRFFELLNFQHVAALVLIAIIFMILFGVGLAFMPLINPKDNGGQVKIIQKFADGINKGNGPFPMIMALIIAGTVVWAFLYILFYGLSEVKL